MKKQILFFFFSCLVMQLSAQPNLVTGTQNRVVAFAHFNGDPEIKTPRENFESMFNGETNSMKSYFKAISNDKLTVNSLLFPQTGSSYELKFCYYCYDSSWKGTYPNCKSSEVTSLFDINIGFIIKDLASRIEAENLSDASALDSDNDGFVDNFVIVFKGAARGMNKGIYTPQNGTVSSTFTNTNGEIQINGKTIKNYTITFERNSLDTHCRFLLEYMGFPVQYRYSSTLPRTVGAWDPMDGPQLSYPLVYNRMKYSQNNWISEIPQITEPGVYTLSSTNNASNNAYKILSSDKQQFWVLEYRDKSVTWDTNLPESGLIIYRVNTNYIGSETANPEVYLYRKDGTPTVAGNVKNTPFSDTNGRMIFNSASNPNSFLSNGTISEDVDISDIKFDNGKMSFKVNKAYASQRNLLADSEIMYVISGTRTLTWKNKNIEQLSIFDLSGRKLDQFLVNGMDNVELSNYLPGIYLVKSKDEFGEKTTKISLQ